MVTLIEAASNLQEFAGASLTKQLAGIEFDSRGKDRDGLTSLNASLGVDPTLLESALLLKQIAGQVNTHIHAMGVLILLPHILRKGEVVEALSLGAGNTGKPYDVETNFRVAEFKFTQWRGNADTKRQNSLFKDFYSLAESSVTKEKHLYVIGKELAVKFLNGRRALNSVMTEHNRLWKAFQEQYGERFQVINEYYQYMRPHVVIEDIDEIVPHFGAIARLENVDEDSD